VKIPAYSSVTAFLAHYRALKSAASRSSHDEQLFAAVSAAIATLAPQARGALESVEDSARIKRHRDRDELQLRRELAARGIVAG
jgi:hypothetical protein